MSGDAQSTGYRDCFQIAAERVASGDAGAHQTLSAQIMYEVAHGQRQRRPIGHHVYQSSSRGRVSECRCHHSHLGMK